ncbi:MAG: efflux RND transporter periplasmic adaptor subunit [Dechloromonas sp.]|nr:efflux RND transporter periplasmic adaptor subunit [Dechloromonas sp.]
MNQLTFPAKLDGADSAPPFRLRNIGALSLAALILFGCGKNEQVKADVAKESAGKPASSASSDASTKAGAAPSKSTAHPGHKRLTLTEEEIQASGVKIGPLQEQQVNEQITVTASIQANQDKLARVAPRVAGKVIRVMANLGDQVTQGRTLALIDSIEVGEAHSAYAQAASEFALAKATADRAEKLYSDQIIPQKEYLRARADLEKSKAVLRAAAEKRQALGIAGPATPQTGGSVFAVVAPFSGTIIEKKAVLGELAQSDKALFSIADLSNVWIDANLYEKDLGKVRVGAQASVTVAAYPNEVFKGKVTYISSMMDKETRTAKARVEVPNPEGRLKLDMFATASIAAAALANMLLLPEEAVVLVQGQPTAFVQEDGGFEPRAVNLGEKLRGQVILKAGVRPGERVVTSGAYALKAKMLKSQISAE